MMNMRNVHLGPLAELGLVAVLGLAGAAAPGRADADHARPIPPVCDHADRLPPAAPAAPGIPAAPAAPGIPAAPASPGIPAAPGTAAALPALPATGHRIHDLHYVYLSDDQTSTFGDSRDIERARRLRRGKEPLVWFRSGGQDYVIRDPAILQQIDAAIRPVRELGNQQGELGRQQGELGKQQGELGARMSVIGTREGTLAVRESALAMRDQGDALTPAEKDQLAHQRRALHQHARALRKEMRALERQMRELGQRMQALGPQMQALGPQMQIASARAEAELRALFQKAIASGTARPAA